MIRRLVRKYVGDSSKRTSFGLVNFSWIGDSTSVSDGEVRPSVRRVSPSQDLFFREGRSNRLHENAEILEDCNTSDMERHGVVFLTFGIVILSTGREDAFGDEKGFMVTPKTPR